MNIKTEGILDVYKDPVETILKLRNLDTKWLNADESNLYDGHLLRNFNEGKELLYKHQNGRVVIIVDQDTDGYTSAATMYLWLQENFPNMELQYVVAEGKTHGIIFPILPPSTEYDLLIIPDASSSEKDKHKKLAAESIDILILDHHEITEVDNPYAIVINPHHPECEYPNKNLSGVGVVYKFIEAVDDDNDVDNHSKYLDLVATGLVADVMQITNLENKAIVNIGTKQVNNPYLQAYFKADGRLKNKSFDATAIGFYIAPAINALIRMGTVEEKTNLFRALIGDIDAEYTVAQIISLKGKQDRGKEPVVTRIVMNLQKEGRDNNKLIFAETPKNTISTVTGLIAGQLAGMYKKPVLLGRLHEDGFYSGSARSINKSSVENLKDFCEESGLFEFVAGHQAAFGWKLHKDKVEAFLNYAETNLPPFEQYYSVFQMANDKGAIITQLEELKEHYGPGFDDILLYDEFYLNEDMAQLIGAKNNTLRIQTDELTYIGFKYKGEIPEEGKIIRIVGKPNINYYNGQSIPQIIITDFETVDLVL